MVDFTIYPAIDLRQGRVVRLRQGDPTRETLYADDPGVVAQRWLAAGASWLHVVNLDGAFGENELANREALRRILEIAKSLGAKVQFGGGLRSLKAADRALEMGASRVVLGTLAAEQPDSLVSILDRYGSDRIAAGIDAQAGFVKVRGWVEATTISASDLASRLAANGLRWLIFTDIARDGEGTGLNLDSTIALAQSSGLNVIASGGAASLEDVRRARDAGLAGVILGRALYEGKIDLHKALGS